MLVWPRQVTWPGTQITWERTTEGHEEEPRNMGSGAELPV